MSVTATLTKTQFNSGAAPTVTQLIPVNTTPPVAVSAQTIAVIPIITANQQFLIDPFDMLALRLAFVTPAGSTMTYSGAYLDVNFNYN